MEKFGELMGIVADYIWGPWTAALIILVGVYLGIGTRFVHVTRFPYVIKETLGNIFIKESDIKGEGTLTPFQSATVALSATIGVGNIVGVATALVMGGPGAIFWMWLSALIGAVTKYSEVVLSIEYREKDEKGNFIGGPAWYIKNGLKSPKLGILVAIAMALFCLTANMVQSNAATESITEITGMSSLVIGIILFIVVGAVTIGGVKRVGKVTEKLIPLMALFYIVGGLIVVLVNISQVPAAIGLIFSSAFGVKAVGGGVAGFAITEAIRYGMARGVYSNEAGMGTAPMAHATAKTDSGPRQGLWGITEVFLDTFVICTLTALAVLTTGVLDSDVNPVNLVATAFGTVSPLLKYIVSISLALFAYSTVLAVAYYGEASFNFIGGEKFKLFYRFFFLPFTIVGAVGGLAFVWNTLDVFIGIILIPNLIALLFLSPKIFKVTREFFGKETI